MMSGSDFIRIISSLSDSYGSVNPQHSSYYSLTYYQLDTPNPLQICVSVNEWTHSSVIGFRLDQSVWIPHIYLIP